jgi:hypothetical protein
MSYSQPVIKENKLYIHNATFSFKMPKSLEKNGFRFEFVMRLIRLVFFR